jgi:biopolymer transport protein ExbB/TolQ
MNSILDFLLLGMAGLTAALILFKAVELYTPGLFGRKKLEVRVLAGADLESELEKLESGMVVLATMAATAPFVGLAATVLQIRAALTLVGGAMPDTSVIAGPIATALGATLLGLASAIPAAAAYNLFARRLQVVENGVRRRLAPQASLGVASASPVDLK